MIRMNCPSCNTVLEANENLAGQQVACLQCGQPMYLVYPHKVSDTSLAPPVAKLVYPVAKKRRPQPSFTIEIRSIAACLVCAFLAFSFRSDLSDDFARNMATGLLISFLGAAAIIAGFGVLKDVEARIPSKNTTGVALLIFCLLPLSVAVWLVIRPEPE